jgi:hypothetical protein
MLHCGNIVLGLPLDFSESGFVKGDFSNALKMQEYISEKISIGDIVEIVLINGTYQIRHDENVVGYLSECMYNQLTCIVQESNPKSKAPPYLSDVYVSNIVTVTPSSFPEGVVSYFRESKFWLGLELTGFPKIDWRYASQIESHASDW